MGTLSRAKKMKDAELAEDIHVLLILLIMFVLLHVKKEI